MIGSCTGHPNPDLWFPEFDTVGRPSNASRALLAKSVQYAINICRGCPVRQECLAEGMKNENLENGIWGGTLPGERIVMSGASQSGTFRRDAIVFAERMRAWQEIS